MSLWRPHRLALLVFDALLVVLALYLAYQLRFDFHIPDSPEDYATQFLHLVPFVVAMRLLLFYLFRLYKGLLLYASVPELIAIVFSMSVGTAVLILFNFLTDYIPSLWPFPLHSSGDHILRIPRQIVIMEWFMGIVFIGGMRFSRRILLTARPRRPAQLKRVLIIGAGDLGESVARDMLKNPHRGYRPVGFIDNDPLKIGRSIHNVGVLGNLKTLPNFTEELEVDEIIVAIPRMAPHELEEIVAECQRLSVEFKTVPSVTEVMEGKVSVSQLRPIEIEDLLGREPVRLELSPDKNYLKDQVVLVTGAGGSIGAELCRQIMHHSPQQLILVGKGENSLYEIASELNFQVYPERVKVVVGDVRDRHKMENTFAELRPAVVFHAAAHKHVPFMELEPEEAVKNNILGTFHPALMADRFGARRFVFISTDKAVRATSIMGATKRVAEMIVYSLGQQSPTLFLAVRFGNVLGSRGSVIPLFKHQIERGGPVTVTHPEVERYFMTIPEAVSLVILSAAIGETSQLYILDMGEPIKIVDLARNMIRLAGLEPEVDVPIRFIGLRPGEKLKEELITREEGITRTEVEKILKVRTQIPDWKQMQDYVEQFHQAALAMDAPRIRDLLRQLVPDYEPTSKK